MKDFENKITQEAALNSALKAQGILDKALEMVGKDTTRVIVVVAEGSSETIQYIPNPSNNEAKRIAKRAGTTIPRTTPSAPKVLETHMITPGIEARLVQAPDVIELEVNGSTVPFGTKLSSISTCRLDGSI